jgi:hypothetical protein
MYRGAAVSISMLTQATTGNLTALERELAVEEQAVRNTDKIYWIPLRRELEQLRHARL